MVENIQVGHIGFNKGWIASKSLEQFMEHEKHHGLSRDEMQRIFKEAGGVIKQIEKKAADKADE